jgi:hypothetical protein
MEEKRCLKTAKQEEITTEDSQASPDKLIAHHDFNSFSYDFGMVTRKKNSASGERKICFSSSIDR